MSGFLDIQRIYVPRRAVDDAHEFLQHAGLRNCEGFALWVGRRSGKQFHVTEAIIPAQTAYILDQGVCVTVDGNELHRLNVLLHQEKLGLIAQIHSHPTGAYHSETDDDFPIATVAGALSIVVPDFAKFAFSLSKCAVYRLQPGPVWEPISTDVVQKLIIVGD